jgi:hypothetical protein
MSGAGDGAQCRKEGWDEEAEETEAAAAEVNEAQAPHDQATRGAQTAAPGGATREAEVTQTPLMRRAIT